MILLPVGETSAKHRNTMAKYGVLLFVSAFLLAASFQQGRSKKTNAENMREGAIPIVWSNCSFASDNFGGHSR